MQFRESVVLLKQLSDAGVVIFLACGDRGNGVAHVVAHGMLSLKYLIKVVAIPRYLVTPEDLRFSVYKAPAL